MAGSTFYSTGGSCLTACHPYATMTMRTTTGREHSMLLRCNKCDHEWTPRVVKPQECPACKSRRWKGQQEKITNEQETRRGDSASDARAK